LPWIAPGLIDNQINGYANIDFSGDLLKVSAESRQGSMEDSNNIYSYSYYKQQRKTNQKFPSTC
jgi:hypothetical protein